MQISLFEEYATPACTKCDRFQGTQFVCMQAKVVGKPPVQVIVIGEAPGEEEDKLGEPFIGPSGQKLRTLLEKAEVQCYMLTNAVRCAGDRTTPTGKQIQACRNYLKEDLASCPDVPLVLVGATALKALQYDDSMNAQVNRVWFDNKLNRWVACIIHPAAVLRNPQLENIWKQGEEVIRSVVKREVKEVQMPENVIYNRLPEKIEGLWYLDTETNMLDMFHKDFACTHICIITEYPYVAYVIDDPALIASSAKRILEWWQNNPPVVQNAPFDCLVLIQSLSEKRPIQPLPMRELRVYPYLRNPDSKLSLVSQLEEIGVRRYWGEEKKYMVADMLEYVIKDTAAIRMLYQHYQSDNVAPFILNRLNDIVSLAHLIDWVGIPVDVARIHAHIDKLGREGEEYSRQLGIPRYVLDSPQKLGEYLGVSKTDEETLSTHAKVPADVAAGIRAYRHATKLQKFASNLLELVTSRHPLGWPAIHASFNPLGTNSGRWSASSWNPQIGFNPQTIPPELRDIVQPPSEEYVLLECDYSQIELRVAAWAAGVSKMKEAFLQDKDLHRQTAQLVFGQTDDNARKKAKAVNFGFLYGMQAEKFRVYAKTMFGIDFSLEEAEEIRRRFFEEYHELNTYYARIEAQVRNLRQVKTAWGRTRYFLPLPQHFRQAINFFIQSTAADIALEAGRRMLGMFSADTILPCLQVHDSYTFILHKRRDNPEFLKMLSNIMTSTRGFPFDFDIPLVVDIKRKEKKGDT